jgi:hypothetical protein
MKSYLWDATLAAAVLAGYLTAPGAATTRTVVHHGSTTYHGAEYFLFDVNSQVRWTKLYAIFIW